MTEPKFAVGQHVAVCTSALDLVIPMTTIIRTRYFPSGMHIDPVDELRKPISATWVYKVADDREWIAEWCLRPIDPDTEYLPEQEAERTVSQPEPCGVVQDVEVKG